MFDALNELEVMAAPTVSRHDGPIALPLGISSPTHIFELLDPNVARNSTNDTVANYYARANSKVSRNASLSLNRAMDEANAIYSHFLKHMPAQTMTAGTQSPAPRAQVTPAPVSPDDDTPRTLHGDGDGYLGGQRPYKLVDALTNMNTTKQYVYVKKPAHIEELTVGTTIVFFWEFAGWERGEVSKNRDRKGQATYVQYADGKWSHKLGSEELQYISEASFMGLLNGVFTEQSLKLSPGAWCIVDLK